MKNLLAILAVALVAFASFLAPALAAQGTGNESDDEKQPTMSELKTEIRSLATALGTLTGNVATLTGNVATLTNNVASFAGRGHQVAVVQTVPRSLHPTSPNRAYHVDFYLVGHSTIPGFPAETVAATGKFQDHSAALPQGTFLFELQHPIAEDPKCHANVSHMGGNRAGIGPAGRGGCPGVYIFLSDGTATGSSPVTRFDGGFGVYTVTSTSGRVRVKHKMPAGLITESRPITSFKGAIKITQLK